MDSRKVSAFQPTPFSGLSHESAQEFLNQLENYAKLSDLDDDEKIVVFNLLLRGLAKFWFEGLSVQDKQTFDAIKTRFKDTYLSQSKNWITTQKLEGRKLATGEKVETYIQDVIQMGNNIGLTPKEQQSALIRGLTPKLRSQLITHNPQTLADTIERIYLSETALNLQNQESVNVMDSMTTCQLAGLNAAVKDLGDKVHSLAEQNKGQERQGRGANAYGNEQYEQRQSYYHTMQQNAPQQQWFYPMVTNQGTSRTFSDHQLETHSGDQQSMTLALCVDVGDTLSESVNIVTTEEQSTCSLTNRGTSMEEEECKVNHNHQRTIMGSSASEFCQLECKTE